MATLYRPPYDILHINLWIIQKNEGRERKVAHGINTFMIMNNSYHPMHGQTFPTNLMEKNKRMEKVKTDKKNLLAWRCRLAGVSSIYYFHEWNVPTNFPMHEFQTVANGFNFPVKVTVTRTVVTHT